MATSLNNLALLYYLQGHYAQAELHFKKALVIFEKTVPDHPDIATVLKSMAALYAKMGREDEARIMDARAERIRAGQ